MPSRTWLTRPDTHPPAQAALHAVEADGWRRDAERLSEPYLDGRQMLTIQYTHGGRTVTLTLMTDTSVSVHPHWYPSGRTEGFVHWDRLATRMRDLQAHPTSQETV